MTIPLTAQHLANQQGGYEPLRANNGLMIVTGDSTTPSIEGWNRTDGSIALSLESFPLPKESNTQIEMRFNNARRKVMGPANVEDMEVVIRDFYDREVMRKLWLWRRMVAINLRETDALRDNAGADAVGLARDYKRNVAIYTYAPNGQYIQTWNLGGVWPSAMDPGDIDHNSEDIVKITMTLVVDLVLALPSDVGVTAGVVGGSVPQQ